MQTSKEPLNCRVVYVELCFPFVKGKVLKVQPNLPATVPFRVGEKKSCIFHFVGLMYGAVVVASNVTVTCSGTFRQLELLHFG